jgi:hypothetical protein
MKNHITLFKRTHTPLLQLWKGLNAFLKSQLYSSELWQLDLLSRGAYSSLVQKIKTLNLWTKMLAVVKDVRTGLHALLSSATINNRIFIGLGFVGIVSPLSACFYLFMLLGPYLAGFFLTLGVFFLFPKNVTRSYSLVIPMAYLVGKILWLYFTTSNAEYWAVPHWTFFAMGFIISMVILMSSEWLTWRKFHRADSFDARQKGLYQIADSVDAEKWKSMMMETLRQKYEFNEKF